MWIIKVNMLHELENNMIISTKREDVELDKETPSLSPQQLFSTLHILRRHINHRSFTLCLVGGIIGRMENNGWKMVLKTVFSTVWEAKKNRDDGKSGRKFSSRTHQFFSSQIGRKTVERKLLLT